jgi:hypothetical protein
MTVQRKARSQKNSQSKKQSNLPQSKFTVNNSPQNIYHRKNLTHRKGSSPKTSHRKEGVFYQGYGNSPQTIHYRKIQ